ncbi:helix-turn-helix domain-containing protein [Arthrobacter terrae]|uniref:helix-turn-helix domain-containing protein n=1 Tax=Arthrobacter terrae TaxID=2935737 RepID=UPI0028AB4EFA|nr:hypothetical protein [Arthrobacter terrae]
MAAEESEADVTPSAQLILARRLNLLLDVVMAERGSPLTFPELQKELADRGVSLSRARWSYMKDGTGRLVSDPQLLTAISDVFDVDPAYLLGDDESELPERIDSRLEFVRSLRAARVKTFAARALGDVSPETLKAITDYLNKDIKRHSTGERLAANYSEDTADGQPSAP